MEPYIRISGKGKFYLRNGQIFKKQEEKMRPHTAEEEDEEKERKKKRKKEESKMERKMEKKRKQKEQRPSKNSSDKMQNATRTLFSPLLQLNHPKFKRPRST